jgi:hypothetical protein
VIIRPATKPAALAVRCPGSVRSQGSGNGQFNQPAGITVDTGGNIWVVDGNNDRVQKFGCTGTYLSQFGSESYLQAGALYGMSVRCTASTATLFRGCSLTNAEDVFPDTVDGPALLRSTTPILSTSSAL